MQTTIEYLHVSRSFESCLIVLSAANICEWTVIERIFTVIVIIAVVTVITEVV